MSAVSLSAVNLVFSVAFLPLEAILPQHIAVCKDYFDGNSLTKLIAISGYAGTSRRSIAISKRSRFAAGVSLRSAALTTRITRGD